MRVIYLEKESDLGHQTESAGGDSVAPMEN